MNFLAKPDRSVLLATSFALVGSALALFVIKLWRARMFFRRLQKRGMIRSICHSLVQSKCWCNTVDVFTQFCLRSSNLSSEHFQTHFKRSSQDAVLRRNLTAGLCQGGHLLCEFLAVQRAIRHGDVADIGHSGDSDEFENLNAETACTEALICTSGRWA